MAGHHHGNLSPIRTVPGRAQQAVSAQHQHLVGKRQHLVGIFADQKNAGAAAGRADDLLVGVDLGGPVEAARGRMGNDQPGTVIAVMSMISGAWPTASRKVTRSPGDSAVVAALCNGCTLMSASLSTAASNTTVTAPE